MRDRFDLATYRALLDRVARANRNLTFADLGADPGAGPDPALPGGRFFLLRHDVDYSPSAALRLAEVEARDGFRAPYFLLPGAPTYDLMAPEHAGFARRLVELGHDLGLHYDARAFAGLPPERRDDLLETLAKL